MSDTHLHIDIPAGYELTMVGQMLRIAPIAAAPQPAVAEDLGRWSPVDMTPGPPVETWRNSYPQPIFVRAARAKSSRGKGGRSKR